MRRIAAIALMLLAAVASGAARAQVQAKPHYEPARAADCLGLASDAPAGEPVYPAELLQRDAGGQVMVRLTFAQPDMPGTAEVLSHEGGDGFVAAVLSHLRHLRAPCFAGGPKPARVDVGFAFVPAERRVVQAVPLDPDEAERRGQRSCLTPAPETLSDDYPSAALSRRIQGTVLLEATFTAPDGPPELKAYARPRAEALKQAVLHEAQALRLSCLDPASVPVTVHLLVPFRLAEAGQAFRQGFPLATDFRQMLAWISPAHRSSMPSSSQAMGCPFTLSLTYWQPDARNQVQQRGDFHPARQPLVDWFARATLAVPDSMLDDMYGSATLFRVPCYKIQSTPSTNKE